MNVARPITNARGSSILSSIVKSLPELSTKIANVTYKYTYNKQSQLKLKQEN